jgi:threonine synthase
LRFHSTRGESPPLGFTETFAAGMAPDGGLYVPEELPDITSLIGPDPVPYHELASRFFRLFNDEHSLGEIEALMTRSHSKFANPVNPAPLVQIAENTFVLELFHGPTLAFKDFGLQLVGNLFEDQISRTGMPVNVLGATSGDTGSAAINGLAGKKGARVFILYPKGRISELQERQMTCTEAGNIFPIAIDGSFDDAQNIIKELFGDLEFKARANLSAVNSINLVRILAQCVYYIHAFNQLAESKRRNLRFVVPTGNFGNILAGWMTARMGMPADCFVVATNQNDLLYRLFTSGQYQPGKVSHSLAPSMDIQVASNFERFLHYHLEADSDHTRRIMARVKAGETVELPDFKPAQFSATRTDDEGILENIRAARENLGYLVDPHTACAFQEINPAAPTVILATAHPAKFPDTICKAVDEKPEHPSLEALKSKNPRNTSLPATCSAIRDYLEENILKG